MRDVREQRRAVVGLIAGGLLAPRLARAQTEASRFRKVPPGTQVPRHKVFDRNGRMVDIPQYEKYVTILNLWATWCSPCVRELPALERLRLAAVDFKVLLLSQDKGGAAIASQFLDRLGLAQIPSYSDPNGRFFKELGCRGLPTTFVILGGEVRLRVEGDFNWDASHVPGLIRKILL
jgi:thiol-disulfide isomerase/thioredoxin